MRPLPATVVVLSAAILWVAGCGSTTSSSSTPVPTFDPSVRAAAAQAYAAAAARANSAKATLQAGPCVKSDNGSLTACSSGLATAEQTFADDLAKITFPPDARGDADSLMAISRRVIGEERSFAASANPQADSTDFSAIEADDKLLAAAVAALRRDLGLTPPPSLGGSPTP
jgi:hypothetical protein